MKIIEFSERPDMVKKGIQYIWDCWGNENNFNFYEDAIIHSLDPSNPLPKFYLALEENKIIGCCALLTNDICSRQDLIPWFGCLFVSPENRKQGIAEKMLRHGLKQAHLKGFSKLYLSTDLDDFYEKKGWIFFLAML